MPEMGLGVATDDNLTSIAIVWTVNRINERKLMITGTADRNVVFIWFYLIIISMCACVSLYIWKTPRLK